jgi:hypothetical protein
MIRHDGEAFPPPAIRSSAEPKLQVTGTRGMI